MKIAIIGGGASGMILASKIKNRNVTLFEKNSKLGKKLLLTGNGKCNFTNMDFENLKDIYNNDFAINIYKKYDNYSFIEYFKDLGIVPKVEKHKGIKYLYPNTNKATSVYYNLLDKINCNNVNIILEANIEKVELVDKKFKLSTTDKKEYLFDKLVISTGGNTYRKTGSDGSGYKIAKYLGHSITDIFPGLCAFKHSDKILRNLKGIRVEARVKVDSNEVNFDEVGEIQFTESRISGIPIMNLSRKIIKYLFKPKEIKLDFSIVLNNYGDIDLISFLKERKSKLYYKSTKHFLCGFLPDELSEIIIKRSNVKSNIVSDLNEDEIRNIASIIRNFAIVVAEVDEFDTAQITVGGIDVKEINEDTLESKIIKNLYFIGEVLDIDGKCGGYNLQIAYSTASVVADNL